MSSSDSIYRYLPIALGITLVSALTFYAIYRKKNTSKSNKPRPYESNKKNSGIILFF